MKTLFNHRKRQSTPASLHEGEMANSSERARMSAKSKLAKKKSRLPRLVLSVALAACFSTFCANAAYAEDLGAQGSSSVITQQTSDPSTLNDWKNFYATDGSDAVLNTDNAGGVWVDKSVFGDSALEGDKNVLETELDGELEAGALDGVEVSDDNFMVVLSSVASTKSIVGYETIPTDTMIVLDLSSSMYDKEGTATVGLMLNAVNATINELQNLNKHNRVGIVIYFGNSDRNPSTAQHAMVMLPLDRYTGVNGNYLKLTATGNLLATVEVINGVKGDSSGPVSASRTTYYYDTSDKANKYLIAGTYTQLGIELAREEFEKADTVIETGDIQAGHTRLPIMVLMSDGAPTAASVDFAKVNVAEKKADMGSNTVDIRCPEETDFVTQLTAAYTKSVIDAHYVETTPLFYTLSLGNEISIDVMDPLAEGADTTGKIKGYWEDLVTSDVVENLPATHSPNGWGAPVSNPKDVVKVDGFPSSISQRDYVDVAFDAGTAGALTDAFEDIVEEIIIQSKYSPTYAQTGADRNLAGYVEFYDTVSEYMEVKDVEGILDDGILYTGEDFCRNMMSSFGNVASPTDLGNEFVWAVQARLGIDSVTEARSLIGEAWNNGQLACELDGEGNVVSYSNYIGWWADEDMNYLEPWDGSESAARPGNARFAVKSYGVLGKGGDSEMLYSYIDVCLDVTGEGSAGDGKGETKVVWGIPSSLLPVVEYSVALQGALAENTPATVTLKGADSPIRLLFEVGLRNQYSNPDTIISVMNDGGASKDATSYAVQEDGSYLFYTNEWMVDGSGNVDTVTLTNTVAYFEPSLENERYYFTENKYIYPSGISVPYGNRDVHPKDAAEEFHFHHYMFAWGSDQKDRGDKNATTAVHHAVLGEETLAKAEYDEEAEAWYIPKGTFLDSSINSYAKEKASNPTGTLAHSDYPYSGSIAGASDRLFAINALGNNGAIPVMPSTGIVLSKVSDGTVDPTAEFEFAIEAADPSAVAGDSRFTNGRMTVTLKAGDARTISGISAGEYKVEEIGGAGTSVGNHYECKGIAVEPESAKVSTSADGHATKVKVGERTFVEVEFTNGLVGERDLVLTKRVVDGNDKVLDVSSSVKFEFKVTLEYSSNINQSDLPTSYSLSHGAAKGGVSQVKPVSVGDGSKVTFSVYLSANDTVVVYDVPAGTEVTVSEVQVADSGFKLHADASDTDAYGKSLVLSQKLNDSSTNVSLVGGNAGLKGTVANAHNLAFGIENEYDPQSINAAISLTGDKTLYGRDKDNSWNSGDQFTFVLQQQNPTTLDWANVGSPQIVTLDNDKKFDFGSALNGVTFTKAGEYWFRVLEVIPKAEDGATVDSARPDESVKDGITYYEDDHVFVVVVKDAVDGDGELTGSLYIDEVASHVGGGNESNTRLSITGNGSGESGFAVNMRFFNDYKAVGSFDLSIPVQKAISNNVVGTSLAGFMFGLYDADGNLIDSAITDEAGVAEITHTFSFVKDIQVVNGVYVRDQDDTAEPHGYYVKEIVPSDKIPGLHYDDSVHELEITVSDNGLGELTSKINWKTDADAAIWEGGDAIEFTNGYPYIPTAPTASVTISASKTLDGEPCGNRQFSFQLRDEASKVVATAVNGAGGAVSFGNLTFDEAGTYVYTISEVAGADEKFEYDSSTYKATVTVTEDASGNLSASVAYSGTPVFANKTKHEPVSVAFGALKTLDGKEPGSNAFLFVLSKDGTVVERATNSGSGTIAFGSQTFDAEGVYKFTLSEVAGSDESFEYDSSKYEITVTVTKGEDGKLVAATSITKDGVAYGGTPVFANKTVENPELPDTGNEDDPELPDTGDDPKPGGPIASTGDGSPILLLVAGLVLAALTAAVALVMKRRNV